MIFPIDAVGALVKDSLAGHKNGGGKKKAVVCFREKKVQGGGKKKANFQLVETVLELRMWRITLSTTKRERKKKSKGGDQHCAQSFKFERTRNFETETSKGGVKRKKKVVQPDKPEKGPRKSNNHGGGEGGQKSGGKK